MKNLTQKSLLACLMLGLIAFPARAQDVVAPQEKAAVKKQEEDGRRKKAKSEKRNYGPRYARRANDQLAGEALENLAPSHGFFTVVTAAGPRQFYLMYPENAQAAATPDTPLPAPQNAPLLVVLEGQPGAFGGVKLNALINDARAKGFVVIKPEASDAGLKAWADGRTETAFTGFDKKPIDDAQFIVSLVKKVKDTGIVDKNKIIVMGDAGGGVMAQSLVCKRALDPAGLALFMTALPADVAQTCTPAHKLKVFLMQATGDRFFPAVGGPSKDVSQRVRKGAPSLLLDAEKTAGYWRDVNKCGNSFTETRTQPLEKDAPYAVTKIYGSCGALFSRKQLFDHVVLTGAGGIVPMGKDILPRLETAQTRGPVMLDYDIRPVFSAYLDRALAE